MKHFVAHKMTRNKLNPLNKFMQSPAQLAAAAVAE